MTSAIHQGSCLCGAVAYEVEGAFAHFFLCHCTRCQKGTGTVHGANLFAPGATLRWRTGGDNVRSYNVPGSRHARAFCQTCGSPVASSQFNGTLVVVPAGSLDTPVEVAPTGHLFCASRANWEDALREAPRFDGLPG